MPRVYLEGRSVMEDCCEALQVALKGGWGKQDWLKMNGRTTDTR